jgi:hypothetical protein
MATNLHLAPPSKIIDGALCVPIDISHIEANLLFDIASQTAVGDATITFEMGPENGQPIFDLRQAITEIFEDGSLVSTPLTEIVTADFGGGTNAEMKVLKKTYLANSSHTLRLKYTIGMPIASTAGSYQPQVLFSPNRLVFNFGFTDLGPGRYLESFIPANLIYDQFTLNITAQLLNTAVGHTLITNGLVANIGANHWQVGFGASTTALSTLFEIRATDTITAQTDNVLLPISGQNITIEGFKLNSNPVNLTNQINALKAELIANENNFGSYIHGNKFTLFSNVGGMEYDGGTTSNSGSLGHEAFHSWWARGVKPSSQPDAWWDEAITTYFHDYSGNISTPFNFANAPIELCTRNPWVRKTALGAYSDGNTFWKGISALIGNSTLNSLMKSYYNLKKGKLVSTTDIEAYLLAKSGNPTIVDAFHRYIFGFPNPTTTPNIWMKDDTSDVLGNNLTTGRFWDSPDIWVRNIDDGGNTHQSPEYGQNNWIYARVRNKSLTQTIKHFAVAVNVKQYAGTQFTYPNDFLPCLGVATGFDLLPDTTQIVKIKWNKADVPPANTHACIVAAALTRGDDTTSGSHVWESNNLAQKNISIVDLQPNGFVLVPFLVTNNLLFRGAKFKLQLIRPKRFPDIEVGLIHNSKIFKNFESINLFNAPILEKINDSDEHNHNALADNFDVFTNKQAVLRLPFKQKSYLMNFKKDKISAIDFPLKKMDQLLLYLKIQLPAQIVSREPLVFDLLQTTADSKKIVGGIAIQINVIN